MRSTQKIIQNIFPLHSSPPLRQVILDPAGHPAAQEPDEDPGHRTRDQQHREIVPDALGFQHRHRHQQLADIVGNAAADEQIPKDARGRFITGDGTVFQGYLFDQDGL